MVSNAFLAVKRSLICLSALTIVLAVSRTCAHAQLADSAWPHFHGDAHNTGRSEISVLGGWETWHCSTGGAYESASGAIGHDGTIYMASTYGLQAVGRNGVKKWTYSSDAASSTPSVGADGTVYYGTHGSNFYAVNPDGSLRWSAALNGIDYGSSSVIDSLGRVYVGTGSGYFTCFDGATGIKVFEKKIGSSIHGSPVIDHQGRVIVGTTNGALTAFGLDGTVSWTASIGSLSFGSPAVASDGNIYIGGIGSSATLFSLNSQGGIRWTRPIGKGMNGAPAIAADGTVYAVVYGGELRAYNPAGALLWSYLPQGIVEGYFGSPVIDETGNIFFTARDASYTTYLFAIDPSGNEIWKTKPSHAIVASPAIGLGGEIYTFGTAITCLVPEPASVVVMAVGISSLLALRRRSAP